METFFAKSGYPVCAWAVYMLPGAQVHSTFFNMCTYYTYENLIKKPVDMTDQNALEFTHV